MDTTPSLRQLQVKLHALHRHLQSYLEQTMAGWLGELTEYQRRFDAIANTLRSRLPALFEDMLHVRAMTSLVPSHADGRAILRDIEYCLGILANIDLDESGAALRVTREGAFFSGHQFDAIRQIQEIVATATSAVVLIDGYADQKTLDLLTVKSPATTVSLLTKGRCDTPAFRAEASAFNAQYGGLSVRASENFHDRFLFIDDSDHFHFGASIKDAGKRAFMFSRIEEPAVIDRVRDMWGKEWAAATMVI